MAIPDDLYRQFQNIQDRVRAIQAARPQDYWADYPTYQAAMVEICDRLAGPIIDEANIGIAIAHNLLDGPPPPSPSWHGPSAGFYAGQRYGNTARQWGNLTIPTVTPKGVLIQVHGGGWMMGDPNAALILRTDSITTPLLESRYLELLSGAGPSSREFYGLRAMASYAANRWGVIVWEPAYTYSTGNPDVCLADVKVAIRWLYGKLNDWGGIDLPVVYAGHSAGGQLSLRAALDPEIPAPKAWLGMAAAGLTVHAVSDVQDAPGGFNPGSGTGWIFQTAWGNPGNWPKYAPDTHLADREERFPLFVEQGNLNNHDDGSVNIVWARRFAQEASGASWSVTYHEQPGADHFAVRWDQSATTRTDMDAIFA